MYTAGDIYVKFKEIEGIHKSIPSVSYSGMNRLSEENRNKLQKMADYFNTIWQNIDIDNYLKIGFDMWKSFNINKIDDPRIIQKYKRLDKKRKINFEDISNDDIIKSINYIKKNYSDPMNYCNDSNFIRTPVNDYVTGKIDAIMLMFLIEKKYLSSLQEEEKMMVYYFVDNYESIKYKMYEKYEFILKHM
ncbi:MAG: hypothetical protein ACOCQD_03190 [archaeon]